jgi:hypothetical protein
VPERHGEPGAGWDEGSRTGGHGCPVKGCTMAMARRLSPKKVHGDCQCRGLAPSSFSAVSRRSRWRRDADAGSVLPRPPPRA